jgi:NADPH-dependent 2,4-dienoyl-CoA reductase/sulfur reductase-like enzyme
MNPKQKDLVVIGGGPAGLAAALAAKKAGIEDILILERDEKLGGILNQCIHNGFGLHTFHEELTGPEYAACYIDQITKEKIEYQLESMVLDIDNQKNIMVLSPQKGFEKIQAKAIVLAMGCRERPRGALNIPGSRPAGIYSAGTAQHMVNIEGCLPGKKVVILGSGDIGLIMARRMSLEGAQVLAVAELMPYSAGLQRNIVQCLQDYNIPLYTSTTVVDIEGKERVKSVTLAKVDENLQPIAGTEQKIECDTLLLSCGLIPENELSRKAGLKLSATSKGAQVDENLQTSIPGIFACGNVLHVHDLVDYVSAEAAKAGASAAAYIQNPAEQAQEGVSIETKGLVSYVVPEKIHTKDLKEDVLLRFRVKKPVDEGCFILECDGRVVLKLNRPKLLPANMQELKVKKELLQNAQSISLYAGKKDEA